jgi:methionyl aminopeptidase
MIPIKTCQDIDRMKRAGRVLAQVMQAIAGFVKTGVTTGEIDAKAAEAIAALKVRSAFKNYRGYPAHICVSVNEEVVHGIPGPRRLREGDIVSLDIGIEMDGYYADMAETFAVGAVDTVKSSLVEAARLSLEKAIEAARPGNKLFDISHAVQKCVESRGFSVVRHFVGHGIGRQLHEEPQVPNFGAPHTGPVLREGMVFAIEPMINAGTWEVEVLADGWTAVTKDRQPSAHFEHTVAVGKDGPVVLTR